MNGGHPDSAAKTCIRPKKSIHPENNARFGQVIGRHFHFDLIPNDQSNETFAHLSGDVGKHLMSAGKFNPEHRTGKHGGDFTFDFDSLFFIILLLLAFVGAGTTTTTTIAPTAAASTAAASTPTSATTAAILTARTARTACATRCTGTTGTTFPASWSARASTLAIGTTGTGRRTGSRRTGTLATTEWWTRTLTGAAWRAACIRWAGTSDRRTISGLLGRALGHGDAVWCGDLSIRINHRDAELQKTAANINPKKKSKKDRKPQRHHLTNSIELNAMKAKTLISFERSAWWMGLVTLAASGWSSAAPLNSTEAVARVQEWMLGNPLFRKFPREVAETSVFPESGGPG